MANFELRYAGYKEAFEENFIKFAEAFDFYPNILAESMRYSMLIGGKRIRPVLMLCVSEILSVECSEIIPYAIALEMIHTYSLIHDDLPAMDNDDYRRGKLSNHKVFGEANGILAGDALLNEACNLLFKQCYKGERYVKAAEYLALAAGARGMIAGQSADLLFSENNNVSKEDLEFIYEHKTGKLLLSSVMLPAILSKKYESEFERFGKDLGKLFQITDDLLDVTGSLASIGKTPGKDKKDQKLTAIGLYGLEKTVLLADEYKNKCIADLEEIPFDTDFLRDLVVYVRDRKK